MAINEGPVILRRNGRVFMVYSARPAPPGRRIIRWACSRWKKTGIRWIRNPGPNRCSPYFAKAWKTECTLPVTIASRNPGWQGGLNVYHALPAPGVETALRSTRIQKFGWKPDGTPDFGVPSGESDAQANRPGNHVFGFITSRSCKGMQSEHGWEQAVPSWCKCISIGIDLYKPSFIT